MRGQDDLLDVVLALRTLRLLLGFGQRGQQQSGQNGNDGDDDEQFDQREAVLAGNWMRWMVSPGGILVHRFQFRHS